MGGLRDETGHSKVLYPQPHFCHPPWGQLPNCCLAYVSTLQLKAVTVMLTQAESDSDPRPLRGQAVQSRVWYSSSCSAPWWEQPTVHPSSSHPPQGSWDVTNWLLTPVFACNTSSKSTLYTVSRLTWLVDMVGFPYKAIFRQNHSPALHEILKGLIMVSSGRGSVGNVYSFLCGT